MNDVDGSKRASPPTPSPPPVKRAKTEHDDFKRDYAPPPLPLSTPRGVERIPLPASLNPNRLSSQHLARLTGERIDILRRQGRHVVGLPVVLNDGIVLNWVRGKQGPVAPMLSHNLDNNVRQSATWFAPCRNEMPCPPVVSTGGGSGTSSADAIVINSDDEDMGGVDDTSAANAIVAEVDCEDVSGASSLPRTDPSRELPINHGIFSDKDVVNFSDPNIELLSSIHPKNKVDHLEDSYHLPLPTPAGGPDPVSSSPPSRCTLKAGEHVASDSEADTMDEGVNNVGDLDYCKVSPGPSLPSLQPIRKLLAGRKPRGDPEHIVPPQRTIVAPEVPKKQGMKMFPEEAPAITSSEDEEEIDCLASDPQLKRVPLPKTDHGRARRLLVPESADLPLVAVTMRGDCHFIERKKKYRISGYSLPNPGVFRHVGDVCMVGDTAILGCDKGAHQISFLSVAGRPQMTDVTWSPHSSGPRYQDTQQRGVSRLAAIHAEDGHIKFLSGGYDGTIHRWTAGIEALNEPRSRRVVSHGASIMALAYRDRDRSVMACAQKKLYITDLNRCKTVTHLVSNDIQQIHIHPQAAYVTLLEVRHLDHQIQLYDSRKGDFDSEPCMSFGHRGRDGKFSGRYTRGSVHLLHFAMTSEDEGVLLWDFRNSKRAVIKRRFRQAEQVVHTIFADSDIATFGRGVVTFFEDYLPQ